MAEAVHADHAFFSTCGSSLSVKAAMLAVAKPGDRLVLGRDVHKSVVSGLVLGGIEPVWVEPSWDSERHMAHPPSPEAYEHALEENPDACGAFVTSPTPYGTCADVRAIAEACHQRGVPLIVDEAWGARLPFHPDLPSWAMDAGADVCVTSVHKMGAGLEQGSVYHLQGDLVEAATLRQRADLFDTTSPSVLIYAALDGWRRQMAEHGRELMAGAIELAAELRSDIEQLAGLHVHGREDFCGPGRAYDMDPLQVIVDISPLDCTGYQAADWLREHHGMDCHLSDHRRLGIQLSFADGHETTSLAIGALADLVRHAAELPPKSDIAVPEPGELRLPQAMSPREAYFAPVEDVPAGEAAGRIAAAAVVRLDLIVTLRELGLPLADVRRVLHQETTVAAVAAVHVRALDVQLRTLRLRRAVLAAVAKRQSPLQETALMNKLARLSAEERRRLIEDFADEVFGGIDTDPWLYDRMRHVSPDLPEDPSPEQVDAWVEVAGLVRDPEFRATMRELARTNAEGRTDRVRPQARRQTQRLPVVRQEDHLAGRRSPRTRRGPDRPRSGAGPDPAAGR